MSTLRDSIGDRTIRDFGEQWVHYGDNAGFYGSTELFADIIGPLLALSDLRGLRIAEIGSATTRATGAVALDDLKSSYGQFAHIHLSNKGVVD